MVIKACGLNGRDVVLIGFSSAFVVFGSLLKITSLNDPKLSRFWNVASSRAYSAEKKKFRERRAAYDALESRLQALGAQQKALKEIELNPRLGQKTSDH